MQFAVASSVSRHKDLGYEFMRFIQRLENRRLIDVEVGGVPMTKNAADHPYYQSLPTQNSTSSCRPRQPMPWCAANFAGAVYLACRCFHR